MTRAKTKGTSTQIDILIGQRLRHARRLAGISQSELASAAGVTFQQIQKYEKGANRIAASRLVELAVFLDRPIDWFLTGARETLAEEGLSAVSRNSEQAQDSSSEHRIFTAGKAICDIPNAKIQRHLLGIAKEVSSGQDAVKTAQ
ncbi:MAG: XRE family transcriptional regulator [Alphaproteobacteria bacterium]|nr:XRE family transcriptional regulator [Alphaproteobacteria bacterium]